MVACPRLAELTIICPRSLDTPTPTAETVVGSAGRARSAISELAVTCKTLPDFDTLQIVYSSAFPHSPVCGCGRLWCFSHRPSTEHSRASGRSAKKAKHWAIDCLKRSNTEFQERQREKEALLRESTGGAKDLVQDCSNEPEAGRMEGGGRKRTTLRVITLTWKPSHPMIYQGSVKLEEHKV